MIVRQAIFLGDVTPDQQAHFDQTVREEVIPLLQGMPGIRVARALKTMTADEGAQCIYQIYHLEFDSLDDMQLMLESEQRKDVHDAMARILPHFDGEIVHYVHETA